MNLLIFIMFLNLCLSLLLVITMYTISIKSFTNREKSSPFECGFDPQNSSRLPFSIQFFIVGVVFLIFDVEISLLIPMPMLISSTYMPSMITTSMVLICVLLAGLYYEWYTGALKWFK